MALALAAAGLAEAWDLGRRSPGLDFYQFWVVAQVAGRDDVPNVYGDEARARVGEEFIQRSLSDEDSERRRVAARPWRVLVPLGTPLLYAAFRPLSGGSYEGDYEWFRLVSLIACVAGLLGIARLVGHGPAVAVARARVRGAFLPAAEVGHPRGQRQRDPAGRDRGLPVAVVARRRLAGAGGGRRAAGVAGRLQAQPAAAAAGADRVLVPARPPPEAGAAGGRDWRWAQYWAPSCPLLAFGSLDAWPDWFAYVTALPPATIPLQVRQHGAVAAAVRDARRRPVAGPGRRLPVPRCWRCLWLGRRKASGPSGPPAAVEDTAALSAGTLVYLLSAPMVWLHYLLLALPAAILLLRDGPASAPARAAPWPPWSAVAVDPLATAFGLREILRHQAIVTSIALLSLFALLCREIAGGEPAAESA